MIDQPEGSASVEQQEQEVEIQQQRDLPLPELQHPVFEENQLAIVPYQPPVIQQQEIFIGMARIVAGPPLPLEMV